MLSSSSWAARDYRAKCIRTLTHPLFVITAFYLIVVGLVRPWGDFPLNDDWQYARVAKHLAETGRFEVDVSIAPSLVGQSYLAAALIRLFGFSHTLLRVLTMVLTVVLLWTLDSILRIVGARRSDRMLGCALLVLNPIFLHLSFSYMTEVYGYLVAFLAVWLWFAHRKRFGDTIGKPIASIPVCLGVATLVGVSFWFRQFCVAVLPALFGSSLIIRAIRRDWQGIARSIPRLLLSSICFICVVLSYFVWAKATGNYRPEFSGRLNEFLDVNPKLWTLSGFEVLAYLTAFMFPFALKIPFRNVRLLPGIVVGVVTLAIIALGTLLQAPFAGFHHHAEFPYSANIVNNSGVGPFTLSLEYWDWHSVPHWSEKTTTRLAWVIGGLSLCWSLFWATTRRPDWRPRELRYFSLVFGAVASVLFVQAYQNQVLDRYYFPWIIAAMLLLASAHAEPVQKTRPIFRYLQSAIAFVCVGPLAWYTISGMHDYFRWNDARWSLVNSALTRVEPDNLDGGFEVNGWLNFDYQKRNSQPKNCAGHCRCAVTAFNCTDDTYQISVLLPAGRDVVEVRQPNFWLFSDMPMYLTKRQN